jgi:hypothetical protein
MRYGAVAKNVFDGQDPDTLKKNIQNDPNYLNKLLSSDKGFQDRTNMFFKAQFGHDPTAAEVKTFTEIASNQIQNNGAIDLSVDMGNGALSKQLEESGKSEAQKTREAAEARATEQLRLSENMLGVQRSIDNRMSEILNEIGEAFKETRELYQELKPAIDAVVELAKLLPKPTGGAAQAISGVTSVIQQAKENPMGAAGNVLKSAAENSIFAPANLPIVGSIIKGAERATGQRKDGSGNVFRDAIQDGLDGTSKILKYATPGIGPVSAATDFLGALAKPDAKFKDTPGGGIVSRPGMDTFSFQHGDLVFASASAASAPGYAGITTGDDMRGGMSVNISQTINVSAGMDVAAVMAAAKQGAQDGLDAFSDTWDKRRSGGSGARRVASSYG